MAEAARLAADFPDTTLILIHAGLPADRSAEGLAAWRTAMAVLADHENVVVKTSGLGVPGRAWSVADSNWIVGEIVAIFGPEHPMFASNFPVDSLRDSILSGFKAITRDDPAGAQEQLFATTARRIYRTRPMLRV